MADPYATLGVARNADAEEIKKAYRKLARDHHPDANHDDPHAEERFKELNQAYAILSDPERRQRFDLTGDPDGAGGGFQGGGFGDLGQIFESFFGGGFGGARAGAQTHAGDGRDLAVEVRIDLAAAVAGTRAAVTTDALDRCDVCLGEGCEPGTYRGRCGTCQGTGQLRQQRQTLLGTMVTARTCPSCLGAGEAPSDPCARCHGDGRVAVHRELEVEVPAGVEDGTTLRLRGRGEPGVRGGGTGDLFVRIRVAAHEVFERRGDDLVCELQIPLTRAVLGADLEIDTIDGTEMLRIPAGTNDGMVLRVAGRGAANVRSGRRGDLLVVARLVVPAKLSEEERALYEQLAVLRGNEPAADGRGLFARLRDSLRGER